MPSLDSFMLAFALLGSAEASVSTPLSPTADPQPQERQARYREVRLDGLNGDPDRSLIQSILDPLDPVKKSPVGGWEFPYLTVAYGRVAQGGSLLHRFRVFTQTQAKQSELGAPSARFLARLWDLNRTRLRLDHAPRFMGGAIDLYLTSGGQAGGEQMFIEDPTTTDAQGRPQPVNVMFVYRVDAWRDPLDRVRELAHEYGHATLPQVGGFSDPEGWPNGELGERLYLRWVRELLAAGTMKPEDAFGVTLAQLDKYLAEKHLPLVKEAALGGPRTSLLKGRSRESFFAWVGLNLWTEMMLPVRLEGSPRRYPLHRAFVIGASSGKAEELPAGLAQGAAEAPSFEFAVPAWAKGQSIWIPLSKGTVTGARVVSRDASGWARVAPTAGVIRVVNPPPVN